MASNSVTSPTLYHTLKSQENSFSVYWLDDVNITGRFILVDKPTLGRGDDFVFHSLKITCFGKLADSGRPFLITK